MKTHKPVAGGFTRKTLAPERTYYDVLGVPPKAKYERIHAAFLRLAVEQHPDKVNAQQRRIHIQCAFGKPAKNCEICRRTETFKQITEAYGVLRDAQSRATYDAQLQLTGTGKTCTRCNGSGTVPRGFNSIQTCPRCGGTGKEKKDNDVTRKEESGAIAQRSWRRKH